MRIKRAPAALTLLDTRFERREVTDTEASAGFGKASQVQLSGASLVVAFEDQVKNLPRVNEARPSILPTAAT